MVSTRQKGTYGKNGRKGAPVKSARKERSTILIWRALSMEKNANSHKEVPGLAASSGFYPLTRQRDWVFCPYPGFDRVWELLIR